MNAREAYRLMRQDRKVRDLDLAPLWQGRSFRLTDGQPMTLRRAEALNEVLRECELVHLPGELLAGSSAGRLAVATAALRRDVEQAKPVLDQVGSRHFVSHFDHIAPDYATLLAVGLGGLRARTRDALAQDRPASQREFLRSVLLALEGASAHLRRWAERLRGLAGEHPAQAELLDSQAAMLGRLADEPPASFWQALQLTWMLHSIFQLDRRYAMALGRLDQFLYPYYAADVRAGRLSPARALELLEHLFAKLAACEGDVQNIAIGGLTPDGGDATNELSDLILDACVSVGQPGGNVTARVHAATPQRFIRHCARAISSGIGYPAVVNDEVLVAALIDQGYPAEEARDYCFAGCIETFLQGRMAPWADSRFNLLSCVNLVIHRGIDSLSGKQVGADTGEPATWDAFWEAFEAQLRVALGGHIAQMDAAKRPYDEHAGQYTSPLLSALTADCIDRGRDSNDGGARWPANHGVAAMGIGVTADALAAVKQCVYERGDLSLGKLRAMLAADFAGSEKWRQMLLRTAPKYGNDDAGVDGIAADVCQLVGRETMKYRTPQGGHYWALMAANVNNIWGGLEVGASADGRLGRQPLSDAASPTFGRDHKGPTAVVRSVARLPYHNCPGGNVVNIKLHPSSLEDEAGIDALAALIRACFDLGGAELQFNVIDEQSLRQAMASPAEHEDLVVRVSGFSAHFVSLDRRVQEDILQRTQHAMG